MTNAVRTGCVAECFWARAQEEDLRGLGPQIEASVAVVAGPGGPVRYLGWLLVKDDDVVLVLFEGPVGMVRHVAEQADIPFGRILQAALSPWPPDAAVDEEVVE